MRLLLIGATSAILVFGGFSAFAQTSQDNSAPSVNYPAQNAGKTSSQNLGKDGMKEGRSSVTDSGAMSSGGKITTPVRPPETPNNNSGKMGGASPMNDGGPMAQPNSGGGGSGK